jgi:hypothetical protein
MKEDFALRHRLSRFITTALLLLVVSIATTNLPAQRPTSETRHEKAQKILRAFQVRSGFPGAVAGFAVGYADRDKRTPMRDSDLLHAGSIGKTFFAALAATGRCIAACKTFRVGNEITRRPVDNFGGHPLNSLPWL